MKLKLLARLHTIIILALLILGVSLLLLTRPSTLAASSEFQGSISPCDEPIDFTEPISPAGQYYGEAILLLENQGASPIELLSAYAGTPNSYQNRFGTFKILKEGDIYYLWIGSILHLNGNIPNPSSVVQRFESRNGLVWCNRTNTNLTNSGSYKLVWGLREVMKNGSTYEGWDEYYYEWSAGWGYALRYITSTNGITWNIVNQPALIGTNFESVIKEGSTYRMWQNPSADASFYSGNWALRHRTSSAPGNGWGDWQTDATLIQVDGSNIQGTYNAPSRVRQLKDGTYQLFYLDGADINLATSTNGITFTTQISNLLNLTQTLAITNYYDLLDFDVVDVGGEDWFYLIYCSEWVEKCINSHIAVSRPIHRTTLPHVYLPVILSNQPSPGFPVHIGNAIPTRPVAHQGEIFFNKTVQIPDQLPVGGHFYFSTRPDVVTPVLVDDEIAVLLNGAEIFTYDFASNGSPQSARLEVPRATMEQLAGQLVTIQYRDVYDVVVKATEMWLIWVP
jgi:hypothetical protein